MDESSINVNTAMEVIDDEDKPLTLIVATTGKQDEQIAQSNGHHHERNHSESQNGLLNHSTSSINKSTDDLSSIPNESNEPEQEDEFAYDNGDDDEEEQGDRERDEPMNDSHSQASDNEGDGDEDNESTETIAPVTDSRVVGLSMGALNDRLTCRICTGYFRDAYTLQECGHSFCRQCLLNHIESSVTHRGEVACPQFSQCAIYLRTADPLKNEAKFDRALQNLVDKLLPHFAQRDEQLKREIIEAHRISSNPTNVAASVKETSNSSSISPMIHQTASKTTQNTTKLIRTNSLNSNPLRRSRSESPVFSASMILRVEPDAKSGLPALSTPIIVAPIRVTVRSVRKLIAQLLSLANDADLSLFSDSHVLGLEHSLEFIRRTIWQDRQSLFIISYRKAE